MSSVKRMFQSYERLFDSGWKQLWSDPFPLAMGVVAAVMVYYEWIINWEGGEWFLAYGILNVVIGLYVVANHDYTNWKKGQNNG